MPLDQYGQIVSSGNYRTVYQHPTHWNQGDKRSYRLPRSRIDAAEDVDESVARLLRQRRAGERGEIGVEVVGVARAGEDDVDARLVAAEAVGGIG